MVTGKVISMPEQKVKREVAHASQARQVKRGLAKEGDFLHPLAVISTSPSQAKFTNSVLTKIRKAASASTDAIEISLYSNYFLSQI